VEMLGGKGDVGQGFVGVAARGDEMRIAAHNSLVRGFAGNGPEAALPKDRLRIAQITLNEKLDLVLRSGKIDDRGLATEPMQGVIAGGNDTAGGIEDEVALGILFET